MNSCLYGRLCLQGLSVMILQGTPSLFLALFSLATTSFSLVFQLGYPLLELYHLQLPAHAYLPEPLEIFQISLHSLLVFFYALLVFLMLCYVEECNNRAFEFSILVIDGIRPKLCWEALAVLAPKYIAV